MTRNIKPTAAEASRNALTAAQQQHAIREEQNRQAAKAAEELVARLAGGDDAPTAADLSLAEYGIKRAGLLVQAADSAVKRAQRALINDDTELGELLRDVLAGIYGTALPIKVTGIPTDATADPAGQPVLHIVQPKPTNTAGGIMSGLLDLVLFRPFMYAPLDVDRVGEACRARGFDVQTHQVSKGGEGELHRDTLRLTINRAFHPVPALSTKPTDEVVRDFARTVNGHLLASVTAASTQVAYMNAPAPGKAISTLLDARVSSSIPADEGTVRLTVTTTHEVTRSSGLTEHYANSRLRDAVAAQDGQVADGVGRVVGAETVSIDMGDPSRPAAGRESWKVTARFILAYRPA